MPASESLIQTGATRLGVHEPGPERGHGAVGQVVLNLGVELIRFADARGDKAGAAKSDDEKTEEAEPVREEKPATKKRRQNRRS